MKYFLFTKALPFESGVVPTEIHVLPLGEFRSGDGSLLFVKVEDLEEIVRRFNKRKNDLVIDYEHQTLTGEKAPAAGWMKGFTIKEDGLWATMLEWTSRGEEHIAEKEYRYVSPVVLAKKKDSKGRLIPEELHSVALTNDPAIDGMVPLAAKDHFGNLNKENVMDEFLEKLCKALGIDPKSNEDQVVEAIAACKVKADKGSEVKEVIPKEITEVLGLEDDAGASEVKATVLALKAGAKSENNGELIALKNKVLKMEADALVTKAMKDGKLTADQQKWGTEYAIKDPEGFKLYVSKAPQAVPVDNLAPAPEKNAPVITDEVNELAAVFGNSKDDLVRFGGLTEAN